MPSLINRAIRAASLETRLYEEVEADQSAFPQAAILVVLSSVAAGIGGAGESTSGFLSTAAGALIGWGVWALVIYLVGTRLFPDPSTHADFGQLMRTLGFACAPGLLRVLGIIPLLGRLVMAVVFIWMLCAMVVAVRQALDYQSTMKTVVVCLVGWVLYVIIQLFVAMFV